MDAGVLLCLRLDGFERECASRLHCRGQGLLASASVEPAVHSKFAERAEPFLAHVGSVGEYECATVAASACHFKSAERLAETHLGVPQHVVFALEVSDSLGDSLLLFASKINDIV